MKIRENVLAYSNSKIGFILCSRLFVATPKCSFVTACWEKIQFKGETFTEQENIKLFPSVDYRDHSMMQTH